MATERIPLTQPIESRDGTFNKDSFSSNCVFERRDQKREFIKRPGLTKMGQVISVTPPATTHCQGLIDFLSVPGPVFNSCLIAIVNNNVYISYSNEAVYTFVGSIISGNNYPPVSYAKTFLQGGIFYLVFHARSTSNHIYVWKNTNSSFTQVTTLPSNTLVPGVVSLDNYTFVGNDSNRIYNSNLGDPTTWDALNFIAFNQSNDDLIAIAKHLNYLVAFGQTSLSFFYDAGNATGSPLAIAQSYTSEIGCANGASVVSTDNTVVWIGTSKSGGFSVYVLDSVSPVKVSNPIIDKHLEIDTVQKVTSNIFKFRGHTLYVLNLLTTKKTLVYDLNEKSWYRWTQYAMNTNNDTNPGTYSESYFRPSFFAGAQESNPLAYYSISENYYVLDYDTATVYKFDPSIYQDDSQSIYCRTVTDLNDNGTTKRKFFGRLEIIGDKVAATMQVRHTGDDYNTWSNYRSVDLNASRSQVYLSGADRRRAWEFLCTDNVPLRLDGAEIDFRIGEMDQEQNVGGGRYRG
jgi:hypothetical protein